MNIQFVPGSEDGDTENDFDGCVYLHIDVVVDGHSDGSLTGWFPIAVVSHIKSALGVQEKRADG